MSWVPAERVLGMIQAQRQVLAAEEQGVAGFEQYHAAERQKLEAERRQAAHDLGQAVLPRLDAASIAAAAQATGLAGLPHEDIPGKLEGRRAWLRARLREIAASPAYANRELYRHPRTGTLVTAIAEMTEHRRPWADVIDACEVHPRFERLWTIGFGTPEHQGSWWRVSHWQDRSAASEIVARFPGKTTFAEVRADYQRARETVAVYDADIARLRGEIAAGEAVEREYAALYEEHRTLDARGLEHTRGRVVQHLLSTDASHVSQRLRATSSPLLLLFLRASGIAAKLAYLDGMQRSSLTEMQKELAVQRQRLDAAEVKTRRRWAPMPVDRYQKLAEDRRPRYEKRWQRFGKVYTSVHTYDRWDRGRWYGDLLWWDLMTRGRYDGSHLPEVADFHDRHPDYHFDPNWKDLAAAQRDDDIEASLLEQGDEDDAHAAGLAIEADHGGDGTDTGGDTTDTGGDGTDIADAGDDGTDTGDDGTDATSTDAS